jgi:hypothetical protein
MTLIQLHSRHSHGLRRGSGWLAVGDHLLAMPSASPPLPHHLPTHVQADLADAPVRAQGDRYEVVGQNFLDFNPVLETHWAAFDLL